MAAAGKADAGDVDYEALYQPTCVNVEGKRWSNVGYILIGCSTVVMIFQFFHLAPAVLLKRADDVSTVLFTIELAVRIFEKGYLFFTEAEKNWNLFDSLVVAISLFSMVLAHQAASAGAGGHSAGGGGAMNNMKALRALRLLRLLRIFRVLKSVERINLFVDAGLNALGIAFLGSLVVIGVVAVLATSGIAVWAAATSWLRVHELPPLPQIE